MNNEDKLNLIYEKYRENKNSHVYLVETNSIEKALIDIKKLIIRINGENDLNDIKKLIETDSLPTLSVIFPENQEIKKEFIEELIKKVQKIPIITKENYFIICNAEKLNQKSGNTMLKMIEEPETDVIGFFIANNASAVLQTIQSRSQYIFLKYDVNIEYDDEVIKDAEDYYKLLNSCCDISINKSIVDKYKDINNLCLFVECLVNIIKKSIINEVNSDIITKKEKIIKLLYNLESNVRKMANVNLSLDKFVIEVGRL